MKNIIIFLVLILTTISNSIFSQELSKNILLKSGEFIPKAKINLSFINAELVNGSYYRFMQFSKIPSETTKNILVENGIQFLEYIPYNTYLVSVSGTSAYGPLAGGSMYIATSEPPPAGEVWKFDITAEIL